MKDKVGQPRTYDEDGFRRRAACICFKDNKEEEILLITSSRSSSKWVIPGGGIDPQEDPGLAAAREVWEEAGVKGSIVRFLGVFQNNERKHRTAVFELIVEEIADVWEESREMGRKREWFPIEEAYDLLNLHKPLQQRYLKLFFKLKEKDLLSVQIPLLVLPESEERSDVVDTPVFASEPSSAVESPALKNYIPFAMRHDGRLYTMAKNSYYAYASANSTDIAWSDIAAVVATVYTDIPDLVTPGVGEPDPSKTEDNERPHPTITTSTSEED